MYVQDPQRMVQAEKTAGWDMFCESSNALMLPDESFEPVVFIAQIHAMQYAEKSCLFHHECGPGD